MADPDPHPTPPAPPGWPAAPSWGFFTVTLLAGVLAVAAVWAANHREAARIRENAPPAAAPGR